MCGTFIKQLIDVVTAQVHMEVHLEAQFAERAVEFLDVPLGSRSCHQLHPWVELSHRHHHCPVTSLSLGLLLSPLWHFSPFLCVTPVSSLCKIKWSPHLYLNVFEDEIKCSPVSFYCVSLCLHALRYKQAAYHTFLTKHGASSSAFKGLQ